MDAHLWTNSSQERRTTLYVITEFSRSQNLTSARRAAHYIVHLQRRTANGADGIICVQTQTGYTL